MAEFDEIGRTIDGFASEDATVVVGTVLDPEMQDEVRVTVVATGLSRTVSRAAQQRPSSSARQSSLCVTRLPVRLNLVTWIIRGAVSRAVGGSLGLGFGLRRSGTDAVSGSAPSAPVTAELPSDYLDIPAFLRRQAD